MKRIIKISVILLLILMSVAFIKRQELKYHLFEKYREVWIYTDKFSYLEGEIPIYAGFEKNKKSVYIEEVVFKNLQTSEHYIVPINKKIRLKKCQSFRGAKGCDYTLIKKIPIEQIRLDGVYSIYLRTTDRKSKPTYVGIRMQKQNDIAVVMPTLTWHAYTKMGDGSFYIGAGNPYYEISLSRPYTVYSYGGMEASLPYMDVLVENNMSFDVLDNLDIHNLPYEQLKKYKLLIFTGHDEYLTMDMYKKLENLTKEGTNFAVFSGNFYYYIINMENNQIFVRKDPPVHADGIAKDTGVLSDVLTKVFGKFEFPYGLYFDFAGYPLKRKLKPYAIAKELEPNLTEDAYNNSEGLIVLNTKHPVYEGLSLSENQNICGKSRLISVEIDGFPLDPLSEQDLKIHPLAKDVKLVPLGYNWFYRGGVFKNPRKSIFFAEFDRNESKFIHAGSVGWYRAIKADEACRKIYLNTVNYLLKE